MPLVIPDGFGQATLEFEYIAGPSNPLACVFGYINDGAQSPAANASFIADAFEQHVMSNGHIANNIQLMRVNVIQNPGSVTASQFSGFVGPSAGMAFPANTTYLIKKATALGGRQGRGRLYMPGPNINSIVEGGVLVAGAAASLTSAFEAFNTDLGSVSIEMYLLHTLAATPPSAVTSLSCDPLVATQRRRIR